MKVLYSAVLALALSANQGFSLTNVTAISTGWDHSLALLSDGTVKSWGDGHSWATGDGTANSYATPVTVLTNAGATNVLTNVVSIAQGSVFSVALLANSNIVIWGRGHEGQQASGGNGSDVHYATLNTNISGVSAIAAGGYHGMAISNGYVYCWGDNTYGACACGTMFLNGSLWQVSSPLNVTNRPTLVPGITNAVSAAAGDFFSLALLSDGTVSSWGDNGRGQLGNGLTSNTNVPQQVQSLTNVMAIAAGGYHALALSSNGYVYAWGEGTKGALGNGTTVNATAPTLISDFTYRVTNTSFVITTNWDAPETNLIYAATVLNTNGPMTNGSGVVAMCYSNSFAYSPLVTTNFCVVQTPVTNVVTNTFQGNVVAIAAGEEQSFALTQEGQLWVWGQNGDGVLGIGLWTVVGRLTPTPVLNSNGTGPLMNVARIATGPASLHALAILGDSDHTLMGWGDNTEGNVGNNALGTNAVLPVLTSP